MKPHDTRHCPHCERNLPHERWNHHRKEHPPSAECDSCYFTGHCVECGLDIPWQDPYGVDDLYVCPCKVVLMFDYKLVRYVCIGEEDEPDILSKMEAFTNQQKKRLK